MTISEIIKKTLLAGVGAGEKFKEFVDELAKAGEVSTNEASKLVKEWSDKAQQTTKDFDSHARDAIAGAFEKMNIATRADVERLEKKLQGISERLGKIEDGGR